MKYLSLLFILHFPLISWALPIVPPVYESEEAELLAMEASIDQLFPPEDVYRHVVADLAAIRQAYPQMKNVRRFNNLQSPPELGIELKSEDAQLFETIEYMGENTDVLEALQMKNLGVIKFPPLSNLEEQYQPIATIQRTKDYLSFFFKYRYNPQFLENIYQAMLYPDITKPIGGRFRHIFSAKGIALRFFPTHIEKTPLGYAFSVQLYQDFLGDYFRHFWEFSVINGKADLIREYGTSILQFIVGRKGDTNNPPLKHPLENSFIFAGKSLGHSFQRYIEITQPINEAFDFYVFMEVRGQLYSLYYDGHVELGIKPIFSNIPPSTTWHRLEIQSQPIVPLEWIGEVVTLYTAIVQAGKVPVITSLDALNWDEKKGIKMPKHLIMFDRIQMVVKPCLAELRCVE